jgi:betaine-aldehyde dehydrogenase
MEVGAKSVKKVTLELGGKSPIIVCKDADIDQAVDWVTTGIFFNAGQVCSATSRLILHQDLKATFLQRLKDVATQIKLGNGQDETTKMGPLVSKTQQDRVMSFINAGLEEGATLVCGGVHPQGQALKQGFFISPTIFSDVHPHMKIWREEIFGPVLSVATFSTEDEAVHLANDSSYGLGAAVLSQNKDTCERIAKKFQAGIVWINCSQPTLVQAPWGGYKKSGTGRELGPWGLMNYLEVKQITRWVNAKASGWNWFTPSKL